MFKKCIRHFFVFSAKFLGLQHSLNAVYSDDGKNLEVQEQKLDLKTFILMVIFYLLFAY